MRPARSASVAPIDLVERGNGAESGSCGDEDDERGVHGLGEGEGGAGAQGGCGACLFLPPGGLRPAPWTSPENLLRNNSLAFCFILGPLALGRTTPRY